MVAVSFKFKKELTDVTTKREKVTQKPTVIHRYNLSMNGCDCLDQNVSFYNIFDHKTYKWWKIFSWITQITQINVFILYALFCNRETKKIPLRNLKQSLTGDFWDTAFRIQPGSYTSPRKSRPAKKPNNERHSVNPHLIAFVDADRNCVLCSSPKSDFGKRRKKSGKERDFGMDHIFVKKPCFLMRPTQN